MARLYIEDDEGNFVYLNVRWPSQVTAIVEAVNKHSNGTAKIERELDEIEEEELLAGDVGAVRRFARPSSSSIRSAARRKRGR